MTAGVQVAGWDGLWDMGVILWVGWTRKLLYGRWHDVGYCSIIGALGNERTTRRRVLWVQPFV